MFSLTAIGMMTVASASTGNEGKTEIKPVKKETVSKKKQTVEKKAAAENIDEVREVFCNAWIGGHYYENYYSCFFCWGGADKGCKAELLESVSE